MSPSPQCLSSLVLGSTKSQLIPHLHLHSDILEGKACLDSYKQPIETLRPAVSTACPGMLTTNTPISLDVGRLRSGPPKATSETRIGVQVICTGSAVRGDL